MIKTDKVLILGVTGMLGHKLFKHLSKDDALEVYASARNTERLEKWFSQIMLAKITPGIDAYNFASLEDLIKNIKPDIVINCIGIIKQLAESSDPIKAISINALLSHKVANICKTVGARMLHISTDCVFSGKKGGYLEDDSSDAGDLYGRTKFLGEVYYPHCITLRTSIIGHELKGQHGLIEWFLKQEGHSKGFTKAIFSGFPTVALVRIIADYVIPNKELSGLYHVSSEPISKYELLTLVAERYKKKIEIDPYNDFCADRSLNSRLFREVTGYTPPPWPELVDMMYQDFVKENCYGNH